MLEMEKSVLGLNGLSLIDLSFENDSLLPDDFSFVNDGYQFSEIQYDAKAASLAHTNEENEQFPLLFGTSEPERTRKFGNCNLRESLEWDSAFFTNSGVLDHDELSIMIKGSENGEKHILPKIEAEICRSTDTIFTLKSDNFTLESLESLEAELFEDIRASIRKSSEKSNVENSCSKARSGETDTQIICSANKVDLASRNMLKPKPALKTIAIGTPRSGNTITQSSGHPFKKYLNLTGSSRGTQASEVTTKKASLGAGRVKIENHNAKITLGSNRGTQASDITTKKASLGAGRVKMENHNAKITTGSSRGTQTSEVTTKKGSLGAGRVKIENYNVKITRGSSRGTRASEVTMKKASLGAGRVKIENHNAKITTGSNRGTQESEVTGFCGSPRAISKPALSSQTSFLSFPAATKKGLTRSFSSCDSSGSCKTGKSPMTSARRKMNSGAVNSPSLGSIPKTSSKIASKNKTQSENSGLSPYLMPSNLSSNISPGGSNNVWSSKSSLSSSTANQRSKLMTVCDTRSSISSLGSDASTALGFNTHPNNDHSSERNENQVTELPSRTAINKTSMQTGTLSRSASARPSGLRMPSPKIGFFDGAKSAVCTPNRGKVSDAARGVEGCPTISPKVQKAKAGGISCFKAEEVGSEGPDKSQHITASCLDAEKNGNSGGSNNRMSLNMQKMVDLKEIKITATEGDKFYVSCDACVQYSQDHLKNNLLDVSGVMESVLSEVILMVRAEMLERWTHNQRCRKSSQMTHNKDSFFCQGFFMQ